jgi:hypothetical protein
LQFRQQPAVADKAAKRQAAIPSSANP